MSSINRNDGYLLLDHSNAMPVPEAQLVAAGLPETAGRGVFECATLYCPHCGSHSLKNPERVRPREYCKRCNHYVCDHCHSAAQEPTYTHRTFEELTELVASGRFTLAGSASAPILLPNGV